MNKPTEPERWGDAWIASFLDQRGHPRPHSEAHRQRVRELLSQVPEGADTFAFVQREFARAE